MFIKMNVKEYLEESGCEIEDIVMCDKEVVCGCIKELMFFTILIERSGVFQWRKSSLYTAAVPAAKSGTSRR